MRSLVKLFVRAAVRKHSRLTEDNQSPSVHPPPTNSSLTRPARSGYCVYVFACVYIGLPVLIHTCVCVSGSVHSMGKNEEKN